MSAETWNPPASTGTATAAVTTPPPQAATDPPTWAAAPVPRPARILAREQESPDIFTLRLAYADGAPPPRFTPGQFNMVYLFGVGEVPISIASDPDEPAYLDHTIRVVGRVTGGLAALQPGQQVGLRGPFGRGWPMAAAAGRDLLIVTGGLGCAPVLSVINYAQHRRERFGRLIILQGVRHSNDLIWRRRYAAWAADPGTEVHLAADVVAPHDDLYHGRVTELFRQIEPNPVNTLAMLCGPEVMMRAAVAELRTRSLPDSAIWVSLERNMQCGDGLCGHCQIGPKFVCRDGPVFPADEIAPWFGVRGF